MHVTIRNNRKKGTDMNMIYQNTDADTLRTAMRSAKKYIMIDTIRGPFCIEDVNNIDDYVVICTDKDGDTHQINITDVVRIAGSE
jgi:hypothetical protein